MEHIVLSSYSVEISNIMSLYGNVWLTGYVSQGTIRFGSFNFYVFVAMREKNRNKDVLDKYAQGVFSFYCSEWWCLGTKSDKECLAYKNLSNFIQTM